MSEERPVRVMVSYRTPDESQTIDVAMSDDQWLGGYRELIKTLMYDLIDREASEPSQDSDAS